MECNVLLLVVCINLTILGEGTSASITIVILIDYPWRWVKRGLNSGLNKVDVNLNIFVSKRIYKYVSHIVINFT